MERAELKGTGTIFNWRPSFPSRADGTLRATAKGNVDLHILQLLSPSLDSSGQVKLDVGAQGTRARPDIHGAVQIVDGLFKRRERRSALRRSMPSLNSRRTVLISQASRPRPEAARVTAQGSVAYQSAVSIQRRAVGQGGSPALSGGS